MAQILKIKRSSTTAVPTSLNQGELAYSSNSDKFFIGNPGTGDVTVVGGKLYVDMLDHTAGTLTASSAIVVDASSKIDVINVDNITIDGNTISSTDTNGNINITPNGTGDLVLDGQNWPQADGSADQYLKTNGSGQLSWASIPSGSFTITDGTTSDTFTTGQTLTFSGGTDITTTVSDNQVSFAYSGNTPAIYDNAGTPALYTGITAAEVRTLIDVDQAGTDNSTDVTLNASLTDILSLSTQEISGVDAGADAVIGWDDSAGKLTYLSAADVRTAISVDPSGTDNSTDVTLAGSYDYLTLSGQQITLGQIDLTTDVTGALPNGNLANSDVTIGSTSISLGDTSTTLAGLTSVTSTDFIGNVEQADGSGTDAAGTNLTLKAGAGTGTGTGGSIILYTAAASGSSGSSVNAHTAGLTLDESGNVTVAGNLIVQGTTTTVDSTTVEIGDNILLLNKDESGTPSANAGIEIERGTSANVAFRWNETSDKWEVTRDGTNYYVMIDVNNFESEITTLDGGTF